MLPSQSKFKKDDEYETPRDAWMSIKPFLSPDKKAYDPFYCSGLSQEIFEELGINHIKADKKDFFNTNIKEHIEKADYVLSNPPFSLKKEVLNRLVNELDVPFILIMPTSTINYMYFSKIFKDKTDKLQIVIPKKRIQFLKNGRELKGCSFDCLYFCYKMNLPRDIIFLEN